MQIAMRYLVACAAAIALTPSALCWAQTDTDVQAKAREALEKRLNELQSQPAEAPKPAQTKPAKKQAPPPLVAPSTPNTTVPPNSNPAAVAREREALEKKLNEPPPQPPPVEVAPARPVKQEPASPAPMAVAQPQPATARAESVPPPFDPDARARAQAALEKSRWIVKSACRRLR